MKKSLRVVAGWVTVSLLLTGCSAQAQGISGKPGTAQAGNDLAGHTTGTSASGHRGGNTNSAVPTSGGTSTGGGGSPAFQTVPVAFSALKAGPLTAVWFAQSSPEAFSSGQVGYVTDAHHVYQTRNGGATWGQVETVSGSITGISSSLTSAGLGITAVWTKANLFISEDGKSFHDSTSQLPLSDSTAKSGAGIQQAVVGGAEVWVLDAGTVYRMTPGTQATQVSTTPFGTVAAIAAVDANTCYIVAGDDSIFKTTDGGATWTRVFWPPLNSQLPWQVQIQVSGDHVAVLYWGGDIGVNQIAYILVESNDAGQTWAPMFDESGMAEDYGNPPTRVQQNLGQEPGAFTLLPFGDIVFLGAHASNSTVRGMAQPASQSARQVQQVAQSTSSTSSVQSMMGSSESPFTISTVTPAGKVVSSVPVSVGNGSIWPDLAHDPSAMAASGTTQVFLVGGVGTQGAIAESPDGGATWRRA